MISLLRDFRLKISQINQVITSNYNSKTVLTKIEYEHIIIIIFLTSITIHKRKKKLYKNH